MTTSHCEVTFRTGVVVVISTFLLAFASNIIAGEIVSVTMFGAEAGTGPGLGTVDVPVIITIATNNDNVAGNNIIVPIKRFDSTDIIDMQFNVEDTNGVTEYQFFEAVDNNSGENWISYSIQLGFGVGDAFAPSSADDGLDFDHPGHDPPPISSIFPTVATGQDLLVFSDEIQSAGAQTYVFQIDVPDLGALGGTFTIRQTPVPVPEPSTFLLAMIATVGLSFYRRRRRPPF